MESSLGSVTCRIGGMSQCENTKFYVAVRNATDSAAYVVVGYPGLPNAEYDNRKIGDVILFQVPDRGVFEIRVRAFFSKEIIFWIDQISSTSGFQAGFVSTPENQPFSEQEKSRIAESVEQVKSELRTQNIALEQLVLIEEKLDDIQEASNRLGRKDWLNYTTGLITSVCISAAFAPEITKKLFISLNSAFTWLFGNALRLLG